MTAALLSEDLHLLLGLILIEVVLVLGQELATVLLVPQSHTPIFICQCLEKLQDVLVVFELFGKLALREQKLQLNLLLPSHILDGSTDSSR